MELILNPTESFIPLLLGLAVASLVVLAVFALYDHFYGPLSKFPDRDLLNEIGRILSDLFDNSGKGYGDETATTSNRIRNKPFDHEHD